jgi:tetratricopeptide (TPR) repeat protein
MKYAFHQITKMSARVIMAVMQLVVSLCIVLLPMHVSATEFDSVTLSEISQNKEAPIQQRVAATMELGNISDQNAIIAIGRATRDDAIELRRAAIFSVENWQPSARWDIISPLLNDAVESVRFEAALAVVTLWPLLNEGQRQVLGEQIEAYMLALPNNDAALVQRAYLYRVRGDYEQAEIVFTVLLNRNMDHDDNRIYLEYVELLKVTDRNQQAITLLEEIVQTQIAQQGTASSELYFSLGLAHYREKNSGAAIANIKLAHEENDQDAQVSYTLALLTKVQEPMAAVELLSQAYQVNPQPKYLYSLCELQLQQGIDASACLRDLRLLIPEPIVDDLVLSVK